ncbi:unnamed protein product [Arctogadus glacialis]
MAPMHAGDHPEVLGDHRPRPTSRPGYRPTSSAGLCRSRGGFPSEVVPVISQHSNDGYSCPSVQPHILTAASGLLEQDFWAVRCSSRAFLAPLRQRSGKPPFLHSRDTGARVLCGLHCSDSLLPSTTDYRKDHEIHNPAIYTSASQPCQAL